MSLSQDKPAASEEEGAGYAAPAADMVAAVLLIVLAGWYTLTALGFRTPGGWHTAPGLVPIAIGVTMILMAVGLGVTAWRRRGRVYAPGSDPDAAEESIADPKRTAMLAGIIMIYLLSMQFMSMELITTIAGRYVIVGIFEVATIICLAVLMKIFWGGRLWIATAVAVGWTVFLSVIFRNVFFISLPA
ncbi:tripartite tricarboxylate transporter TctB family protein [Pelagibacterium montanilacus]|uniref:tripartite tricarboxylate transporter TctB family protein n=1 Tax=Pelagibacterium montanilacus TaxID=2185280 RepID=UPI000F8F04EB|nr:tripartite tricarboxylate transporter TctB family protein [Pelagibacterium montanilacus]